MASKDTKETAKTTTPDVPQPVTADAAETQAKDTAEPKQSIRLRIACCNCKPRFHPDKPEGEIIPAGTVLPLNDKTAVLVKNGIALIVK